MRIGIVLQARSGSTRLPKKILKPFDKFGKSIIDILLENLKENLDYPIVLATTTNPQDDLFEDVAKKHQVDLFRGSENNVLSRFIEASEKFEFDVVVRVCSDNPFLNIDLLHKLIDNYTSRDNKPDYLSYSVYNDTVPSIKSHIGLFSEIISLQALKKAIVNTSDAVYLEHVTNYIYGHNENFDVQFVSAPSIINNRTDIRLTIDDPDDFKQLSDFYNSNIEIAQNLKSLVLEIDKSDSLINKMKNNINKYSK